jgi:CheY-like chemotaxis protein
LAEVGILIIDDDIVSQRALKSVLDAEGWRVRIVPQASHAFQELASGGWNLVIVNVALTDLRGPLYAILNELSQAGAKPDADGEDDEVPGASVNGISANGISANGSPADVVATLNPPKRLRVLYLVPLLAAKRAQPILEREGMPYSLKPYHLHDFLEKVSELLVEAGAIAEPIRSMTGLSGGKKRARVRRNGRDARRSSMFASRDDYQMTEEELAEWERQEEEDKKKREKERKEREHLG